MDGCILSVALVLIFLKQIRFQLKIFALNVVQVVGFKKLEVSFVILEAAAVKNFPFLIFPLSIASAAAVTTCCSSCTIPCC